MLLNNLSLHNALLLCRGARFHVSAAHALTVNSVVHVDLGLIPNLASFKCKTQTAAGFQSIVSSIERNRYCLKFYRGWVNVVMRCRD